MNFFTKSQSWPGFDRTSDLSDLSVRCCEEAGATASGQGSASTRIMPIPFGILGFGLASHIVENSFGEDRGESGESI